MNTAQDRANRIAAVTVRSRDLFWIFSITAVMHFVVFGIIAFGSTTANLPITVFIIFGTIIGIMGVWIVWKISRRLAWIVEKLKLIHTFRNALIVFNGEHLRD